MTDLFDQLPALPNRPLHRGAGAVSANGKRLGRPPGARNRGSIQLAKYIEARFAGMTPGQQAAELGMVTAKDLKTAGGSMLIAMAAKAIELAAMLGCDPKEAFLLLQRERAELLKYVHQVQPAAKETSGAPPATVFLVPEGETAPGSIGALDDDDQDPDFTGFSAELIEQVAQPKSHDDT